MDILIVDDDVVDREHIKRTLNKANANCNFVETESVDEGLDAFAKQQFDVVLLDYRMPQRDGIELLLELRSTSLDNSVAIIMLSNSEEPELAIECVRAGAQDFLLKSEVTSSRLQRAILQSQTRFELEQKLYRSYKQAKQLAEHDALTGLANRYSFEEALRLCIRQKLREQSKLALVLFDLDHFKFVNDSHGHDIGDQLLQKVSTRVQDCLRDNEMFARLGGDEFAIILSNLVTIDDASRVTKRILTALEVPFIIAGIKINMAASIGIAISPDNTLDAKELLKFADIAMYRSKKLGKNQICFFETEMQQQFIEKYEIEANLTEALARDEFVLYYQPVYQSATKELVGFEALIRWNYQNTLLLPEHFISIAENSHVIVDIGRWVIEKAIQQISIWNSQNEKALTIAINLSDIQLTDQSLHIFIKSMLKKYQVAPELIEFEYTETALLENSNFAREFMESLSKLGCRITLDDFGSGFSSVTHLQDFPINTVKIDKSLMLASKQPKEKALVTGISMMLHSLGLTIVAEAIENEQSLKLCQELNIQHSQGDYFSRALDAEDVEKKLLKAGVQK